MYTIDEENKMVILDNGDGTRSFIPMDPANSDYQAWLNPNQPVEGEVIE